MTTAIHLARWLHSNVTAIAAHESFDVCFAEIQELTRDIERAVDTPLPRSPYGPCPSMVGEEHSGTCDEIHPHTCGTGLYGHRGATEVKCAACGETHPTEGLFDEQRDFAGSCSGTIDELQAIQAAFLEHVPTGVIQHWAATGRLNPTGWDGTEPRYLLDDIRALWSQSMGEKKKQGKGKA